MKRELKLRHWTGEEMVAVHKITFDDDKLIVSGGGVVHFADSSTVMPYTGLKDKNGREIYEGDLLQCTSYTYGNGETDKISLLVKYDEMSAGFIAGPYMLGKLMDIRKCEVIGNIFEDKQLLGGKQ